ncbi:ATP-binding protein [Guptibacillus hwajinpoensis]|uniref:ATP-binding protein n=1 Tax=Guptibacillus hwajinpoensis TaxID=208199 RepID=UPI00069CFFAE|nr:ATP-binding protein [Alkalihalobacillus macyae]
MADFTYTFHFFLVVISILMVVSYSYTAFDFHEKALNMVLSYRKIWIIGSALAFGAGIWILQYIVILGLASTSSAHYQPWFVATTLLIPVCGSFVSFLILTYKRQLRAIFFASISIALSLLILQVLTSTYLLNVTYKLSDWWRLALPGSIAFFTTISSLWLVYGVSNEKVSSWGKMFGAIVLGIGSSCIYYLTMSTSLAKPQFNVENYGDSTLLQYIVLTGIFIVAVLILISVVRDRKLEIQANQLQESEHRYQSLVENSPDGVMLLNVDGQILNINPSLEKMSGYTSSEARNKTSFQIVEQRFLKRMMTCFEETKKGSPQKCESAIVHKLGHSVKVKIVSIPHIIEGKVQGVIAFVEDITESKETEELLRRSEKLTAVGELAAGVAHEIRNPLTSLKGFANILHSSSKDEKSQEFLQIMLSEIDRINFIVSEFMLLARPQEKEFAESDLISLLRHVVSLLKTQAILKDIVIRTDYEFDHFLLVCEENQIKQVLVNVLKNAIEAMPSGGMISLKVSKNENDDAVISIKDQGVGIPEHQLSRIGEPFYTLKENGTGLGLMVSFNIIENHNGRMTITSIEGEGTTVNISLPAEEKHLVSAQ